MGKLFAPASRSVVQSARVNVPPMEVRFAVKTPRSRVPAATVRSPLIGRPPVSRALPFDLFTVRLLNVVGLMDCWDAPLRTTVPLPEANEPLPDQSPPTEMTDKPPSSVAPAPMVTVPPTTSGALTRNVPPLTARSPVAVAAVVRVAVAEDLLIERLL